MKKWLIPLLVLLLGTVILFFLRFAGRPSVTYLEREELFSLSLGMMEDEMILFRRRELPFPHTNDIRMRDGRFFVANGNASKVMEFSSYGDILSLHYDPAMNPEPVALKRARDKGPSSNRLAWEYPFSQTGQIAVNSRNELFVVDRISEERRIMDQESEVLFDRIIHRFNSDGSYREFLGQEGIGGAPFPMIEDFSITAHDEIVVVCRFEMDRRIYWFSPRGDLLYQIELPRRNLPLPDDLADSEASLQRIYPDKDKRLLYLKLVFFSPLRDEQTGVHSGITPEGSRIAVLDVSEGKYGAWIPVPANRVSHEGAGLFDEEEIEYPFQFVGTASGGHLFFLGSRERDFHQLLILNRQGQIAGRHEIFIEDSQLLSRAFHVAPSGILTGLLCHDRGARVVWWRTDRLIQTDEG